MRKPKINVSNESTASLTKTKLDFSNNETLSLFQNSGVLEDSTILQPINARLSDLCNQITKGTVPLYGMRS